MTKLRLVGIGTQQRYGSVINNPSKEPSPISSIRRHSIATGNRRLAVGTRGRPWLKRAVRRTVENRSKRGLAWGASIFALGARRTGATEKQQAQDRDEGFVLGDNVWGSQAKS